MTHAQRDLLQRLHDAGVELRIDGQRLHYRCPAGALTSELRAALADWKPDLIAEYHERAGILQYDARLPRDEAEGRAAGMVLGHKGAAEARLRVLSSASRQSPSPRDMSRDSIDRN